MLAVPVSVAILARSLFPLSKQWVLSYGRAGCLLHNETWKRLVSSTPCSFFFWFVSLTVFLLNLHVQPVFKRSPLKWHMMSILVVSTATMTPQRSQLMFPLYPPLSVLEKRIPDLLILLFLLSWSLETGDDTDVFAVFWSCMSTVSLLCPSNDTPDNQVSGQWWESAVHEHWKWFDLIVFASFSVAIFSTFLYPGASVCVFLLKGGAPPPLFKAC